MSKFDCYIKHLNGKCKTAEVKIGREYSGMLYVNSNKDFPSYYELIGPGRILVYLSDVGIEMVSADGHTLNANQIGVVLKNFPIPGLGTNNTLPGVVGLIPQYLTNQCVTEVNIRKPVLAPPTDTPITLVVKPSAWAIVLPPT